MLGILRFPSQTGEFDVYMLQPKGYFHATYSAESDRVKILNGTAIQLLTVCKQILNHIHIM